jgi:hypothetical protein
MNDTTPIAERTYFVVGDPQQKPVLKLQIMRPEQINEGYPSCRMTISSDAGVVQRNVSSVDSLDCLLTAFAVAGTTIAGLSESRYQGQLRWLGSDEEDKFGALGLPTIETQFQDTYDAGVAWGQASEG